MNIKHKYQLNPIDSFLESFFTVGLRKENKISEKKSSSWLNSYERPTIKAFEKKNELELQIFVPGWSRKELDLRLSEGFLELTGLPNKDFNDCSLFGRSKLDLTIQIPTDWNLNTARAKLKDGILLIKISRKKIEQRKVLKIS